MKSLDKSRASFHDEVINLNPQKRSKSFITQPGWSSIKIGPLKSKIDAMLHTDYVKWRSNRNKFNAINSNTAKSS
jgi:hypothetical protein